MYKKISKHEISNYNSIRDSTVAWRKKSSYRKSCKRLVSKKIRRWNKKQIIPNAND